MILDNAIWVAQGENPIHLLLNQANRHGLIAGASGTGKTVTLKTIAQGFSQAGVPVFVADVKGDVTGMAQAGDDTDKLRERLQKLGAADAWVPQACPVHIWDMLGDAGIPVRITVSDMGSELLSRMLNLTDVQSGVLDIVFHVADEQQLLLIDLKDLRSMLAYVDEHSKELETTYGRVSSQSIGAILRALLSIEDEGANLFFGEPSLDLQDWFANNKDGQGYINILNASKLIQSPQIYAMFLLWMLSELFETLPEAGDLDKPKFVFFFDEAHLLFNNMPADLRNKIIQVVKLIRSKGVGLYFITQSPSDIPDEVLAQLSNRVQHGLRAYTPAEQKNIKAAAAAFRENPNLDAQAALQELGTGEALISFLNEEGQPSIVERAMVIAPQCQMGKADDAAIEAALSAQGELMEKYGQAIDRESAFEMLSAQEAQAKEADALNQEREALQKEREALEKAQAKEAEKAQREAEKEAKRQAKAAEKEAERQAKAAAKEQERAAKAVQSMVGKFGREAGKQLLRGLFGNLRR